MTFEWRGSIWLPWFQFNRDMSLKDPVRRILAELTPVFDEWELALWLVEPTAALCGQAPMALMESRVSEVINAARLTRFILRG